MDFLLQFMASGRWLIQGSGSANGFSIAIYDSWALADPGFGVSQWIFYCNLCLLGVGGPQVQGSANGFSIAMYGSWALADPRSGVSQWIFCCNCFFQTNLNCKRRRHLLQLTFVFFKTILNCKRWRLISDFRIQIPDFRMQIRFFISDSSFRISDCRCQITDFKLHLSDFRLQIPGQGEPGSRSWPDRRRGDPAGQSAITALEISKGIPS